VIIGHSPFIYGIAEDKPKLPDGFTFRESDKCFLLAIDFEGDEWLVAKDKLVRSGLSGKPPKTINL
jgi:hypothetical protein